MRKLPEIVPWWRSSVQKKRPCIWIGEEHHHHCRLFRGDLSEVIQQVQQQSKQLSSTPTGNYAVSPIMILFFLDFSSTFWNRSRLDWLRECRIVWNAYTLFDNYSKCRIWNFWMLAFSTNFCPIKTDLSGNTVWPQASVFQKLAIMEHFWHFY